MAVDPGPVDLPGDPDDPVLVVGAGPVGLSAALLLARWGVPSLVVEAKPAPDRLGSKAICMQRDVLDILDRVGCAAPLVEEGVTWSIGRTYYREHELFVIEFPQSGRSAFPPWVNVSQSSTERYLAEAVARQPLVEVHHGSTLVALRQGSGAVEADVETPAGPVTHRGSHLVGADGARSMVRHLLGVEFPGHSYADQFLIVDIRADLPFPNERRFYFDPPWNPGRQVLVHEQPGKVFRIDWQVPPDYDLEEERRTGALDARIRRIVGELPYEIDWLSVYRFHERCAARLRHGRAFLVGDAAHLVAPFGARGLNSGVQDAENLAWKLALVRHGWVPDPEVLLDSYDTERRAAALENLKVTSATMEFLVPQSEAAWARRREALERAVGDPRARFLVDSGKLAEPYWYLDSPLTTPSDHVDLREFPTGPGVARPPVAGVLCPDGPCRLPGEPGVARLRQLFGRGFVVVTARADRVGEAREVGGGALGGVPLRVASLEEIDVEGVLADALAAERDSVHVVRPDGHLAAVMASFDAGSLARALRRASGLPEESSRPRAGP